MGYRFPETVLRNLIVAGSLLSLGLAGCSSQPITGIGNKPTAARAADGSFISWREHIIDDPVVGGVPISGSDGLLMADLDQDGYLDIVSVHESDTEYDGVSRGYVRIAYGTADPMVWVLRTLAEGEIVGAAEDVAIVDLNGDGWLDVLIACELAHIAYFQNPGNADRDVEWQHLIPGITQNRGSFIRVFAADFNGDGQAEVIGVNKGMQNPSGEGARRPNPISWFEITGDPLLDASWKEYVLTMVPWPINAPTVDLDGDGDLDIVAGSTGLGRIFWFENVSTENVEFKEHRINVPESTVPIADRPEDQREGWQARMSGFNMDFADLNGDGRLDIVLVERGNLVWLEQPADFADDWGIHYIGTNQPDTSTGLRLGDIDGDGNLDLITGGYSRGPRDEDGGVPLTTPMGRISWFQNPGGDAKGAWTRHDISRRVRGMFDQFVAIDLNNDGLLDFASTRGNSWPWDGVFWLEQVRTPGPVPAFQRARAEDSKEVDLPE